MLRIDGSLKMSQGQGSFRALGHSGGWVGQIRIWGRPGSPAPPPPSYAYAYGRQQAFRMIHP